MDRREFIAAGTLGGAAALFGAEDDAQAAALSPQEMEQFLSRMDRGLDGITRKRTITALGHRFEVAKDPEQRERERHDDELFRKSLRSLLTVGLLHDLPEASRRDTGMQDRVWAAVPDMDDAIFDMTNMMSRLTPAERVDLREAMDHEPDLPMRVVEVLDKEAEALGISMKRRLHLRALGTQVAYRMRQQSPSAVIEEYVGKIDRMVSFHGGREAWNRKLAAAAVNQSVWNSGVMGFTQAQTGGASAGGAAVGVSAAAATGGEPIGRTVIMQSGLMYYGQVVEVVDCDYLVLRLATSEERRIAWAQTRFISVPRRLGSVEPRQSSPTRNVVMMDNSILHGELVEAMPGDYLLLLLDKKKLRRITWREIKRIVTPEIEGTPWARAAVEPLSVHINADGKDYFGQFFELVPGQYLAIRQQDNTFQIIPTANIKSATTSSLGPETDESPPATMDKLRLEKQAKARRILTAGGVCLGLGAVFTGTFTALTISTGNVLVSIGITVGAILLLIGLILLIVGAVMRSRAKK